jgi:hypothetical protein
MATQPSKYLDPKTLESAPTTRRRWRPRYSLLTLLLVVLTASAILVSILADAEKKNLQAQHDRLKSKLGVLKITDPAKPHAIVSGRSYVSEAAWRWRVYLPEGKTWRFVYFLENIPENGYPAERGMNLGWVMKGDDPEFVLEAAFTKRQDQDRWSLFVSHRAMEGWYRISDEADQRFKKNDPPKISFPNGHGETVTVDADGKLLLLKERDSEGNGVLLFIEEAVPE